MSDVDLALMRTFENDVETSKLFIELYVSVSTANGEEPVLYHYLIISPPIRGLKADNRLIDF